MYSNAESTAGNLQFSSPVISSAPGILKNCQNFGFRDVKSPKIHSPVVNKLLKLGNDDENSSSSDCSSPGSPLSDSARKKLRDLPHTTTLQGCVAYVDVWSSDATDNRSSVFRNFLARMGATVAKKFIKDEPITHVVFKDGHKSVLQKAQKRNNIKIVTCLWVDRCRVLQQWVNEDDFLFDPSNYKPPKKFIEMQPLEPDELIRKSAERLKRRKARFAKKNARIMFQSPLVTNSHSAAGTPKDGNTPSNQDTMKKYRILAADTPFQAPSLSRYFSPSIVYETPLTDSMQRMMQRLKEGKRVFSPPSSDSDSDAENTEIKSPGRPKYVNSPKRNSKNLEKRPKFSPVADTQCMVKRSWRKSGLSPPKFNVSCDEIPETQNIEAPDTPEHLIEKHSRIPPLIGGIHEIPETQHMNVSVSSIGETHLPDLPLFTSTAKEPTFIEDPKFTFPHDGDQSYNFQNDSTPEIHLRVSFDSTHLEEPSHSTHLEETSSINNNNVTQVKEIQQETANRDCTPDEQKIPENAFVSSRRKRRKLLEDNECTKPLSILVSPEKTPPRKGRKSSMLLPDLGFSAFKTLTQSGKFFAKLPSYAPSECSTVSSEQSSPRRSTSNTQSTEYDGLSQSPVRNNAVVRQQLISPLSLYDRIKMRPKRSSMVINSTTVQPLTKTQNTPITKKRRRNSDQMHSPEGSETSPFILPKRKISKTQRTPLKKSPLFFSQAARAIVSSLKKRRSTMDFKSPIIRDGTTIQLSKTRNNKKKSVIVLTNFHSDERFDVHKAVRNLSGFRITSAVRDQTTHVVCGAPRRTMNVLLAIARGVWLLSKNWVTDSLSAGFWLEKESYEIPSVFPAAQRNRKCKSRNPMWKNELFAGLDGHMCVSDSTKPSQEEIKELIALCGGSVVGSPRRAVLCIGNPGRIIPDIPVVNETWVLDSITENTLKPLGPYIISL